MGMFGYLAVVQDWSQTLFLFVKNTHDVLWRCWNLWFVTWQCAFRFFSGGFVASRIDNVQQPTETFVLYEFEGCVFSKKVREALCALKLPYKSYPCPRETLKKNSNVLNSRFRQKLVDLGGKSGFPYLYDPNTKKGMYEANDIVAYITETYAPKSALPWNFSLATSQLYLIPNFFLSICTRPLLEMGWARIPATHQNCEKDLHVYTNEAQPFGKLVREALSVCEVEHIMHPVPFFQPLPAKTAKTCWCCWGVLVVDPNDNNKEYTCANEFLALVDSWKTGNVPDETWSDFGAEDAPAKKIQ